MDEYKQANRQIVFQNQELLRLVSLLKEEIVKLNKTLLMEKQNSRRWKAAVATIFTEASCKIVEALVDDENSKTIVTNKDITSMSVIQENLSFNICSNSPISSKTRLHENTEQEFVETKSSPSVSSRLNERITFRPRGNDINVDSICEEEDSSDGSNEISPSAHLTSAISNIAECDCEDYTIALDLPITAARLSEYASPLQPITEESSVLLESSTSTIAEELSDNMENTNNMVESEDKNEQLLLSAANVKVLIAKLKDDDFSKLGIVIPQAIQPNKTQVAIQKKHRTIDKNESERFEQNIITLNKMEEKNRNIREKDKDPNGFQRNRILNKAELTPEKDEETQRFQRNRVLNKTKFTPRKVRNIAEEPQGFQRNRNSHKMEAAKPMKNTKTPEKIEQMSSRIRPKRKAAPTFLVEPSLTRKLRRRE